MEAAIFDAVWRELAETGYSNLAIERIAARAGTSKPVIYRRWPTRARLVHAALREQRPILSTEAPDTGSVRGDIIAILNRVSQLVAELTAEVFFGLVAELLHEGQPSLFAQTHERGVRTMRDILKRGAARGEISPGKVSPRLAALPLDLVRHQLVLLQRPLSKRDIDEIVDDIFLPLIRRH